MSKLEGRNLELESKITPEQELTKKEKAVLKKAHELFKNIAASESDLFNEDDLNLSPERREELNNNLGGLTVETREVLDKLPKTNEADSYRHSEAA
jgi:hypothetical protein